jgi:DNA-directed RNA polymerase specialized sigma24 family protein
VARALEHLTDLQRQSVELAYYGGHTYREVAVLLHLPEGDRQDPDARRLDQTA